MQDLEFSFPPGPKSPCRVRVGTSVLGTLVEDIARDLPARLLIVVTDENVAPLHGERVAELLRSCGLPVAVLCFPAGEASKTRETKAWLEDRLFDLGAGRDSALIAVGGGVAGDLAGFVAATWNRGVPVVQVPTSLLAMVDAAVGGKTGVNLPGGKNLVGSFHPAWGVYADVSTLATLPQAHYVDGFAEVVKSAVVGDRTLFRWLERSSEILLAREAAALERVVVRCLRLKRRLVVRDALDRGCRAVLNFGHTVAHALETASSYRVRHGPAVSLGMCIEARLALKITGFPAAQLYRVEALLATLGLPTRLPPEIAIDAIVAATYRDKKASDGRPRFALPFEIGRMPRGDSVTQPVDESDLRDVLRIDFRPGAS